MRLFIFTHRSQHWLAQGYHTRSRYHWYNILFSSKHCLVSAFNLPAYHSILSLETQSCEQLLIILYQYEVGEGPIFILCSCQIQNIKWKYSLDYHIYILPLFRFIIENIVNITFHVSYQMRILFSSVHLIPSAARRGSPSQASRACSQLVFPLSRR